MGQFRALYWFIDRWRQSSAYTDLTLAEQAAYRNLLDEATLRGGVLPLDDRVLAKACGDALEWPTVRTRVLRRFAKTKDGWRNETLDKVLSVTAHRMARQQRYRDRHAGNGFFDGTHKPNGHVKKRRASRKA